MRKTEINHIRGKTEDDERAKTYGIFEEEIHITCYRNT